LLKNRLILILTILTLPFIVLAQNTTQWEQEIRTLTEGVHRAYLQDISSGSRVFLLSVKKDDMASAYCRSRVESELINVLNGTKFSTVFQPFLQEKTFKYVESTDTTFKVSNQSSYVVEFGNMRTLLDSLRDYNIDLILYSKIFLSPSNHLILKTALIDIYTLKVVSGYTFYGSKKEFPREKKLNLAINIYHGLSSNGEVSRSYGPSQGLTINPFNADIYYDGIALGLYQNIKGADWFSAGLLVNVENNYLPTFDDYIYNINEFRIRTISVAPSLGFHLNNPATNSRIISLFLDAGYGKSEIHNGYYFISSQAQLKLTNWLGVSVQGRYYLNEISISSPFYQDINFTTTQLCGGISINL
tara:strand:- start:2087 stop:3163 length:1077 start_codon:yes stop_codon:yes gene_type:complete